MKNMEKKEKLMHFPQNLNSNAITAISMDTKKASVNF